MQNWYSEICVCSEISAYMQEEVLSVVKIIICKYSKGDPFEANAVIVNKLSVCKLPNNLFSFWADISRYSGKPDLILCSFIKRQEHQATNNYLSDRH
jgi:hypothetical protein